MEVINTFKFTRSVAGKIIGGRKKEEGEESMKLTTQQQKEIKEGILKWETVITRITNTIVVSTTNSSSMENSTRRKSSSGSSSKSSGSFNSGNTLTDTTGKAMPYLGFETMAYGLSSFRIVN
ncbi:hypothetical protein ISN44_As13g010280 [Arabidopsis suecica]|uniref:DUF1216 domain-containing protein n=1 Tax=Arabidopsis suecica TaxID=45249 RepID=A0A8T1XQE6_ARASU|nr:hypothetical protein ISN44_As13g010280 [Arabidopsis suecica]